MKKKVFVALAVILFVGGVMYWQRTQTTSSLPSKGTNSETRKNFYETASGPLQQKIRIPLGENKNTAPTDTPEENAKVCNEHWDQLTSRNLREILTDMESGRLVLRESCASSIPMGDDGRSMVSVIFKACQVDKDGNFSDKNMCGGWILMYRAILIDAGTMDDRDYHRMPMDLLINKALGRFARGEQVFGKDKEDLRNILSAIREREPNNPSSYKISSVMELGMDNQQAGTEIAKAGLEYDPNDRDLRDLYYVGLSQNAADTLKEQLKRFPQDDLAAYHWANALWRKGDLAGAKTVLGDLVARNPEDQRYKGTYENVSKAKDNKGKPFYIQVPIIREDW